jgi:hypothetical protein
MMVAPTVVRTNDGEEIARGYTQNVSEHGLGLEVDRDLSRHNSILAEVTTGDGHTHRVAAKVVRTEARPGSKFYLGTHASEGHSIPRRPH